MNPLSKFRPRRLLPIIAGLGLGASLGMAAAVAVVYVAADRLDIVEKKRAVAKVVTTVDRNTALNVVAKEGAWYKVEVGGKQGYVFERAVSNAPGSKRGQGVALSQVKAEQIGELENAAASRGAQPAAKQYASAKGLSLEGLEQLFEDRESVSPAEYDRFLAEGGLRAAQASAGDAGTDVAFHAHDHEGDGEAAVK